jgi:hypothetical protein
LEVLKWAKENSCPWGKDICYIAEKRGHLNTLKCASAHSAERPGLAGQGQSAKRSVFCIALTRNGQEIMNVPGMNIFAWKQQNKVIWKCWSASAPWAFKTGCLWNKNVCSLAAFFGHVKEIKWARENGCTWDERVCLFAIQNGNL